MRAVVQEAYGAPDEVLRVRDIERPAVGGRDVLVRVRVASVHPDVWHVVTGRPYVLRWMGARARRPTNPVPGTDMAGVVEAVGAAVTRFVPGDEVFGETMVGMPWRNGGAFAEYVAAPEEALALKPEGVGFEQAPRFRRRASSRRPTSSRGSGCRRASACWSTARPAASARSRCSWPGRPGRA